MIMLFIFLDLVYSHNTEYSLLIVKIQLFYDGMVENYGQEIYMLVAADWRFFRKARQNLFPKDYGVRIPLCILIVRVVKGRVCRTAERSAWR